jgi:hypothetical protein
MKKSEKQFSQSEVRMIERIIELIRTVEDGALRIGIVMLGGEAIPTVDIFLTEEEFIENANQDLQEYDFTITKERCRALCSFGFLPRAGFLSNKVKLVPYLKTIKEAISERDDSLVRIILDRKQIIYNAQRKGLLSCEDDLKYVGVRNVRPASAYDDVSQYKGWEPIYLLSQTDELKRLYFRVADRAIKGTLDYKNKLSEFELLIESSNVKEESIQGFLKDNSWMFGTEYIKVIPKKPLSHNFVVDFLLQKFDGSWEVVELELPTDKVLTSRMNLTAKGTHAVGQVQKAQEFIVKHYDFLETAENIGAYKPRGLVVIGNKLSDEERGRLEVINKSYSDIMIITYRNLLKRAGKQVEMLNKLFPS